MNVLEYLKERISKSPIHLTLIDPEKQDAEKAAEIALNASKGGTDGIMIGSSGKIMQDNFDDTVRRVKGVVDLPVIIFPSDVHSISKHADAIFFMSLLNSRDPYYITGAQLIGAPIVKKVGIEPIPTGYIIVEPGGVAGYIGDAKPVPRNEPEIAAGYALAAQYLGMKLVYLEAGSGVEKHVPEKMITKVKKTIDIPLVVGGGIKTKGHVNVVTRAGADIVVTGTIIEKVSDVEGQIKEIISPMKKAKTLIQLESHESTG